MVRTLVWGGVLPVVIVLGALLHPAALLGVSVYGVQVCRLAIREKATCNRPWLRALLLTVSKFAEVSGIVKFAVSARFNHVVKVIEYK